jgi:hypothetical protein
MFRTFAFVAAFLWAAIPASAQTLPDDVSSLPWVFDGGVSAAQQVGGTLFVGGTFLSAARPSDVIGHTAVVDAVDARLLSADPSLIGTASAVVDDGAGGWFLGGRFEIAGRTTPVVRLDAAGRSTAVVTGVAGFLGGRALALARLGNLLFIGGDFTTLGGATRNRLAAIDTSTGQLLPWDPDVTGMAVRALHLTGGGLYAGGEFTDVGGVARAHLAKFDLATGALTSWAPPVAGARVHAVVSLGPRVFVGGEFTAVSGQPRSNFAAVDAVTAALDAMSPDPSGGQQLVFALAAAGNTVYIGGQFATLAGELRASAGAIDATTGALQPWAPLASGGVVRSMAIRGAHVYVGGGWLPGAPGGFAIKVHGATGVRDATWQPGLGSDVMALAVSGDRVAASGNFKTHRSTRVVGLAAIDLASGALLPMPEIDGAVYSLAASASTLYVGGYFNFVGTDYRTSVAAFDAGSRALRPFAPMIGASTLALVESLAVDGSDLYLGGRFTSVNGVPRSSLAAVDAVSGATRPFVTGQILNASFDPDVQTLAVAGGRVWAGGYFTSVGGASRAGLAVFDMSTGGLDPLDLVPAGGVVTALSPSGPSLFVSGTFQSFGNLLRPGLAKVDAVTGAVDAWAPPIAGNGSVVASGALVYAGGNPVGVPVPGSFGQRMLALDAVTGAPVAWDPTLRSRPDRLFDGAGGLVAVSLIGSEANYFARRSPGGAPHGVSDFGVHVQGTRLLVRWTPALSGPLPASYTLIAGSRPGASDLAAVPFPRHAGTGVVIDAPPGTYFLRVVPRANALNGPASREVAFTAGPIGCAPPPMAPTLSVSGGGTPRLAWTPSAGDPVSGYELRVGLTPGVRTAALIPLPGVTTTFSTAGAPPGTYYATVAASYTCGATVESNEVQVVVPPHGAPAAPTALAATVSGRTVSLSWTPPAGAITGYVLEAGSAPGLANIIPALPLGGAPGIVAPNVSPGTYYVRVRAANGALVSAPSNEIIVNVP